MAASPTERTLRLFRKQGYSAGVVEKWIPRVNIRKDLFGFIDIIAVSPAGIGSIAIQATSYSNMSARRNKILENDIAIEWLTARNRIILIGWKKKGARWEYKEEEITLEQFREVELYG